jgi:RNA polymerase sigma factor (sigma-70 family)
MDGLSDKISRILKCLLEAAGPLSASQIAKKTGISTMEINRLIRDAQEFGAPIFKKNDKNESGEAITVFMLKLDAASTKPSWQMFKQLLLEANAQQESAKDPKLAPEQTDDVEETSTAPGGPLWRTEDRRTRKDPDLEEKPLDPNTPGDSAEASKPIESEPADFGAKKASMAPGGLLRKSKSRREKNYTDDDDIIELIQIIQGDDLVAADRAEKKLQHRFEPMIRTMASCYDSCDEEDIAQIARIALYKAAETYDVNGRFGFRAHAKFRMRDAIRRYFRDFGKTIRLSERMQRIIRAVQEVTSQYDRAGKLYSVGDIAIISGLTIAQVEQSLYLLSTGDASSLDSSFSDNAEEESQQDVPCAESDLPEFVVAEKMRRERLMGLCVVLNAKQRRVVYWHNGWTKEKIQMTFAEIARRTKRDRDSVEAMYKRAAAKLKKAWFQKYKSDKFDF